MRRWTRWLVVAMATGCGQLSVSTPGQDNNCRRIAEIAETGAPASELDLGPVRPPLPDGIDEPRGVVLDPQPPRALPPDGPTVGVPDPTHRKVVIVGGAGVAASTLRQRFERELDRAGFDHGGSQMEIQIGGEASEFSVAYRGHDVQGAVSIVRCGRSSRVVVSQTLRP